MPHVFISYSQGDADFAAILEIKLEQAGIDVWIDKTRLRPGCDWSEEIDKGILDAFALIVVVTPNSKASEYVTYEWSFAIGAGVKVVPALRAPTEIHPRLNRLQYADFTGRVHPWDDLISELSSIKTNRDYPQANRDYPGGDRW